MRLRFGEEYPYYQAFTANVSATGMAIHTTRVISPQKPVFLELELDGEIVQLQARVRWARRVPPNLLHKVNHAGMGVEILRFLRGDDAYLQLFR